MPFFTGNEPATSYALSYRYSRLALVGLLSIIAVAVFFEHLRAGCWQGSISAYYYTPARAVFTGALVAAGVCLIALKVPDDSEDTLLNVAGIGAILTAFIPTPNLGGPNCPSLLTTEFVMPSVRNNVAAFLVIGVIALLITGGTNHKKVFHSPVPCLGYIACWALAAAGAVWLYKLNQVPDEAAVADFDGLLNAGHFTGAFILLFLMITLVTLRNGLKAANYYGKQNPIDEGRRAQGEKGAPSKARQKVRRWAPFFIFLAMVLVAVWFAPPLLGWIAEPWWPIPERATPYLLLWLEGLELALFATFWIYQTLTPEVQRQTKVAEDLATPSELVANLVTAKAALGNAQVLHADALQAAAVAATAALQAAADAATAVENAAAEKAATVVPEAKN